MPYGQKASDIIRFGDDFGCQMCVRKGKWSQGISTLTRE